MSDLLQQAMIDAAALKEAAMKNAQNALIEKYSAEFNQTVQKLLEQEDIAAQPAEQAITPPPVDMNSQPDVSASQGEEQADLSAASVDPMSDTGVLNGLTDKKDAFSKIPDSFSDDDDEMITINFDQIRSTLNEMFGERTDPYQQNADRDALGKGGNPKMTVKVKQKSDNSVTEKWHEEELEEMVDSDEQQELEEVEISEQPVQKTAQQPTQQAQTAALTQKTKTPEQQLNDLEPGILNTSQGKTILANYKALVQKNPKVTMQLVIDMFDAGVIKEEELEEEYELNEEDLEEQTAGANAKVRGQELKAQGEREIARGTAMDAAEEKKSSETNTLTPKAMEEEIELTEEELQELAEELRVDLKVGNLSDGYMGSTETQKREQRAVELAAARDEKAAEEREAELEKMKDLMQENKKLQALNHDSTKTLSALKEQLEKMNLINAKLLYTNKALGNVSLNERQKQQIVESISKADSVLEAKTIYETLQNAVENIGKEKEAPQSLRETLNRAATPYAVKKTASNTLSDLMADRMKALAGIKKIK